MNAHDYSAYRRQDSHIPGWAWVGAAIFISAYLLAIPVLNLFLEML